jgi:hypothetical protein
VNLCDVEYVKNDTADVITVTIPDVPPVLGKRVKVRLDRVRVAPMRPQEPCARVMAVKARNFVKQSILSSDFIHLRDVVRDRTFGFVANIETRDGVLNQLLLQKGLAVDHAMFRGKKVNWCTAHKVATGTAYSAPRWFECTVVSHRKRPLIPVKKASAIYIAERAPEKGAMHLGGFVRNVIRVQRTGVPGGVEVLEVRDKDEVLYRFSFTGTSGSRKAELSYKTNARSEWREAAKLTCH